MMDARSNSMEEVLFENFYITLVNFKIKIHHQILNKYLLYKNENWRIYNNEDEES